MRLERGRSELAGILNEPDEMEDPIDDFARFLNQIAPAGKDLVASKSEGVRIMTMAPVASR